MVNKYWNIQNNNKFNGRGEVSVVNQMNNRSEILGL